MISCIIIEDEPLALKRTREYAGKIPYLDLKRTFDNGLEAIGYLREHQVDLIFLDIRMDELSGIQLLESLERKPFVIITTAYSEYALKGYELNVADYLLKPFSLERFIRAVEKVAAGINHRLEARRSFFFVKTDYRIEKVFYKDVLYIEGMRDYRNIRTAGGKILTLQTFGDLEKELPRSLFARVHKSWIVALSRIELIERNRIRIGDRMIPISETYREDFYRRIGMGSGERE